jgi:hypothetical protein
MREKPWTARESALYRDVKEAVASEGAMKERLRHKDQVISDLRRENALLAKAFGSKAS